MAEVNNNETYQPLTFDAIKVDGITGKDQRLQLYGEVKKPKPLIIEHSNQKKTACSASVSLDQARTGSVTVVNIRKFAIKGVVCDRCGVEVTKASVRRKRMGHIELAAPVSHIWYFKGIPSRMGLILDLSPRTLEKVLYFANYIVLDTGSSDLTYKQVLTEREYQEARKFGSKLPCRYGS